MTLKNCKCCGRVFQAVGNLKLCSRCYTSDDDDFKVVRDHLYDYPDSTIVEVSEETGVSENKILKFLRAGKLILKGELSTLLVCEECKTPINTGIFCDTCSSKLVRELKRASADTHRLIQSQRAARSSKGYYSNFGKS